MIRDIAYWNQWEDELHRQTPVDLEQNFRLMDAMYQETRQRGLERRTNPLEGLEPLILYAKAINVPSPSRPSR